MTAAILGLEHLHVLHLGLLVAGVVLARRLLLCHRPVLLRLLVLVLVAHHLHLLNLSVDESLLDAPLPHDLDGLLAAGNLVAVGREEEFANVAAVGNNAPHLNKHKKIRNNINGTVHKKNLKLKL